ncbi:hypothetical protein ACTXT7_013281 [Hymenolepis weldensis]
MPTLRPSLLTTNEGGRSDGDGDGDGGDDGDDRCAEEANPSTETHDYHKEAPDVVVCGMRGLGGAVVITQKVPGSNPGRVRLVLLSSTQRQPPFAVSLDGGLLLEVGGTSWNTDNGSNGMYTNTSTVAMGRALRPRNWGLWSGELWAI